MIHRSYAGWASTCQPTLFARVLCLAAICPALISAQNLADSRDSTISGTVVNSVTQSPIARALVTNADERYPTLTDGAGHFEFSLGKQSAASSTATGQVRAPVDGQEGIRLTARKPGFLVVEENGAF